MLTELVKSILAALGREYLKPAEKVSIEQVGKKVEECRRCATSPYPLCEGYRPYVDLDTTRRIHRLTLVTTVCPRMASQIDSSRLDETCQSLGLCLTCKDLLHRLPEDLPSRLNDSAETAWRLWPIASNWDGIFVAEVSDAVALALHRAGYDVRKIVVDNTKREVVDFIGVAFGVCHIEASSFSPTARRLETALRRRLTSGAKTVVSLEGDLSSCLFLSPELISRISSLPQLRV